MERQTQRTMVAAGALLLAALVMVTWWSGSEGGDPATGAHGTGPGADLGADPPDGADAPTPPTAAGGPPAADPPAPTPEDDDATPETALGGASELTDAELEALVEELEDDPRTHVICDLGVDVRHSEAYLAIGGHSDRNGRRVQVVNGRAYLPLVYDLGDLGDAVFTERGGVFGLDGYGPVDIAWSDQPEDGHGRCTAPVLPGPGQASITGTLTLASSGAPAAGAWLEGCGNLAFADQHGIVHMDIVPEPCTVVAMRQDGLLRTISDPVAVTPEVGRDVLVDIVLPDTPRGGLGVQLSQTEAGAVRIDHVLDTGPAGAAGLREGDVLVAVDGEPLDGLDLGEVVQRIGGEAGTGVGLTVDRGGEQLTFEIVREKLSAG